MRQPAALRDLHGVRLHGFALLLTLGDRPLAARLAATALAEGTRRAHELRHPERAAAWLRRGVLRSLPRRRTPPAADGAGQAALAELNLPAFGFDGLAALSPTARAALVASVVERLHPIDVETVVGRGSASTRSLLADARRRYLAAAARALGDQAGPDQEPGPLASRVRQIAARTLGNGAE